MVRIGSTAAAAAAVLALAACGSIHGTSPWTGGSGAVIDYECFPPPPPVPAAPATGEDTGSEIAGLRASLTRLSADIDESRRHLARLEAEVESTQARIDRLLAEQADVGADGTPATEQALSDRRPLVRLRYDGSGVGYASALHEAVSATLARLPDALFDLVAVTPAGAGGNPKPWAVEAAQLHAEEVKASLMAMGIEPGRMSLSAATSEAASIDEVHLYIR